MDGGGEQPLVHEYEEVLKVNAEQLGLSLTEVDELLNAICARAEEWVLLAGWSPILTDPDDEPLVQLAAESEANRIVTHNLRHLAPATAVGIEVLKPSGFLARVAAA
jgi:predicted nucleic acid-binding protein